MAQPQSAGVVHRVVRSIQEGLRAFKAAGDPSPAGGVFAMTSLADRYQKASRDIPEYLKAYSELPALRLCADVLADAEARVRYYVLAPATRKGKAELRHLKAAPVDERHAWVKKLVKAQDLSRVDDHLLYRVLYDGYPPFLTGGQVRRLLALYRILAGESFSILETNGLKKPVRQVPILPHWVEAVPRPGGEGFYKVRPERSATARPYEARSILWRKSANPADPYGRGTAVARAVSTELEGDEAVAQHDLTVFLSGGDRDILLTGEWGGDKEIKKLEQRMRQKRRERLPIFLNQGDVSPGTKGIEVTDISRSLEELAAVGVRDQYFQIIRSVIGRIPPELAGITGNSNRATAEAARAILASGTIEPEAEAERELLQLLCQTEYDERLLVEFESPVPEDREFRLKAMQARPSTVRVKEWREVQGLPDLEGPEGEGFVVDGSGTWVPDLTVDPFDRMFGSRTTHAPSQEEEKLLDLPLSHRKHYRAVKTAAAERIQQIAAALAPELRDLFLRAIEKAQARVELPEIEAAIQARDAERLVRALKLREFGADVAKAEVQLARVLERAGRQAAVALAQQLGEQVGFDPGRHRIRQWLKDRAGALGQWAEDMGAETARLLLGRRPELRELGEAVEALEARIDRSAEDDRLLEEVKERLGVRSREVAELVRASIGLSDKAVRGAEGEAYDEVDGLNLARLTESVRRRREAAASAFGGNQAFAAAQEGQRSLWGQAQESGQLPKDARRRWGSQRGDRVCPSCNQLDGQERGIDEPFHFYTEDRDGDGIAESGAVREAMNPGEPHNGCECWTWLYFTKRDGEV